MWSSVFWVRSFLLMKSLNSLFLIDIDFCSAMVIQELVLNLSLYLLSFFNGACLSRILLMESKVLERCISIVILKFQNMGPINCKIVKNEMFKIEFRPITSKDVGFFVGSIWKKMRGAIRNYGKWSDMVGVRLPETISWEI